MKTSNSKIQMNKFIQVKFGFYLLMAIGILILFSSGCSKEDEDALTQITSQGIVKDIDGNIYHTITIGTQVWMVENLKTTTYRNGDKLTNISITSLWGTLTKGAYCNYNNQESQTNISGRLYNWYAVIDERGIAPVGWHVASDEDWAKLIIYLGGINKAGGNLKETGTSHWSSPNNVGTDKNGFTALPGGSRDKNGFFTDLGIKGIWWTSTSAGYCPAADEYKGWAWEIVNNSIGINKLAYNVKMGLAIRCIKDEF